MVSKSVLELKLCLLHECLVPEGARDVLANPQYTELLDEVHKEKTVRSYVESLAASEDCFSRDFINTLTEVRICLLGS